MKLCYLDESGQTGTNLRDPQQPHYILGGIIVISTQWRSVADEINKLIQTTASDLLQIILSKIEKEPNICRYWSGKIFGEKLEWAKLSPIGRTTILDDIEIHMKNKLELHAIALFQGTEEFKGIDLSFRLAVADAMLTIAENNKLKYIYVHINKPLHAAKYIYPHPPDEWAFTLMTELFCDYLGRVEGEKTGMFIGDLIDKPERFKKFLSKFQRDGTPYYYGKSEIKHIIDSVHFVSSHDSQCVQMSDLCAYLINQRINGKTKWVSFISRVGKLVEGSKSFP